MQNKIKDLEFKKAMLEAQKNKAGESPAGKPLKEIEDDATRTNIEPKHRDLWQVIYADNRVNCCCLLLLLFAVVVVC